MTANFKYAILFLVLAMSWTGCYFGDDDDGGFLNCVDGDGQVVTQIVDVPSFRGIQIKNSVDVYVRQGNDRRVEVEGQENIIDLLELDVQGKIWDIEFDRCVRDLDDFKIYITAPDLNYLGISGSGMVYSENQLEGEEMTLRISGSGDIDVALLMENVDSKISGSGRINLEGFTEEFYLKISGSGDYNAFDLESQKGEVLINASGDADVFVNEFLDIKINGSGNLRYKGAPLINVEINGSGDVINAN